MSLRLTDAQRLDWLQLIRCDNVGPRTFRSLVNKFGGAGAALAALPDLLRNAKGERAIRIFAREEAEREIVAAAKAGARYVALGATLVGLASPFLRAATVSDEAVVDAIDLLADELRIAMFCTGAGDVTALRAPGRLVVIGDR